MSQVYYLVQCDENDNMVCGKDHVDRKGNWRYENSLQMETLRYKK